VLPLGHYSKIAGAIGELGLPLCRPRRSSSVASMSKGRIEPPARRSLDDCFWRILIVAARLRTENPGRHQATCS
jgi:hypothetical protein